MKTFKTALIKGYSVINIDSTPMVLPLFSLIVPRNALRLDSRPPTFYIAVVMHTLLSSCRRSSSSCPEDMQLFRGTDAAAGSYGAFPNASSKSSSIVPFGPMANWLFSTVRPPVVWFCSSVLDRDDGA